MEKNRKEILEFEKIVKQTINDANKARIEKIFSDELQNYLENQWLISKK